VQYSGLNGASCFFLLPTNQLRLWEARLFLWQVLRQREVRVCGATMRCFLTTGKMRSELFTTALCWKETEATQGHQKEAAESLQINRNGIIR